MSADLLADLDDLGTALRRERRAVTIDELFVEHPAARRRRRSSTLLTAAAVAALVLGGGVATVNRARDDVASVTAVGDDAPYVVFDELPTYEAGIQYFPDGERWQTTAHSGLGTLAGMTSNGWLEVVVTGRTADAISRLGGGRPADAEPVGTVRVLGTTVDVYGYYSFFEDGLLDWERRVTSVAAPDCVIELGSDCTASEFVEAVVDVGSYRIGFFTDAASIGQFDDWLAGARLVDRATWEQTLPAEYLHGAALDAAVAALAAEIPTPPDFRLPPIDGPGAVLQADTMEQVYVAAAVCWWTDTWLAAGESGDDAAAAGAVEALDGASSWPVVVPYGHDVPWPLALARAVTLSGDDSPLPHDDAELTYTVIAVRDQRFVDESVTVELPVTRDTPALAMCDPYLGR